jgi:hypothetical protein
LKGFDLMIYGRNFERIDLTQINLLEKGLKKLNIPFETTELFGGKQICYPDMKNVTCSIICHPYSYGHEYGLLEIMGLLTEEEKIGDNVVGFLTAKDVLIRIFSDYVDEFLKGE